MHSPTTSLPIRPMVGLACGVVLAVMAVYSNTLQVPLVLDDLPSIKHNASIRQLWPMDAADSGGFSGRPVVVLSFAMNYAWGGHHLAGYHLTNLVIHALAALCLLGLVRRTLLRPVFRGKFAASAEAIAGATALWWALHPLQTEAVTYLSQRTESLMGLFYLLTLYAFVRGVDSPTRQRAWWLLAVLACLAGMGTKEVMVTAPVVVLLYDRSFVAGSLGAALRARWPWYLALAASWLELVFLMKGLSARGVGFELGVSPFQYALTETCVVLKYFQLALWPAPLIFDYGAHTATTLAEVWPGALLLTVLVAVALTWLYFRPQAGFLLAWPFLLLAPTSSVVPLPLQPMAEHRMYLPLAGLILAVLLLLWSVKGRFFWIVVLGLGVVLGFTSYRRNAQYADGIALWRDTVAKAPANGRAWAQLGRAYLEAGQLAAARDAFARALVLDPEHMSVWIGLGDINTREDRLAEAVECYERAIRLNPAATVAHYNLGCVALRLGQIAKAKEAWAAALRLDPAHGDAHCNLGIILMGEENYAAAHEHLSLALKASPEDAAISVCRAEVYRKLNRPAEAILDYERALKIDPSLSAVRKQLDELRRGAVSDR